MRWWSRYTSVVCCCIAAVSTAKTDQARVLDQTCVTSQLISYTRDEPSWPWEVRRSWTGTRWQLSGALNQCIIRPAVGHGRAIGPNCRVAKSCVHPGLPLVQYFSVLNYSHWSEAANYGSALDENVCLPPSTNGAEPGTQFELADIIIGALSSTDRAWCVWL